MFSKKLFTKRLTLKASELSDSGAFYFLVQNNYERLKESFPRSVAGTQTKDTSLLYMLKLQSDRENKISFFFLVFLEEELIGMINIKNIDWTVPKCELGYFISKEQEGKGFVKEGISEIIKFCFDELGMNKIFIRTAVTNPRSASIALACGFEKEGLLRSDFKTGTGELQDVNYFGLVRK